MSKYPNRPNHPDFWLISEALLDQDAQTDSGQGTQEVLGRMVDPESAAYAATERAKHALRVHPELRPYHAVLAGMWLDGMMTGMQVQQKKADTRKPPRT